MNYSIMFNNGESIEVKGIEETRIDSESGVIMFLGEKDKIKAVVTTHSLTGFVEIE